MTPDKFNQVRSKATKNAVSKKEKGKIYKKAKEFEDFLKIILKVILKMILVLNILSILHQER